MSKENNLSIFKKDEKEELFERNQKRKENSFNFRKQKFLKRKQLINSSFNGYYRQFNNLQNLLKNQEDKKVESFSNIEHFSTFKKPSFTYDVKNQNITSFNINDIKKEKIKRKKNKVSHLYIDSYDKKVTFSLPDTPKINKSINIQSINNAYNENNDIFDYNKTNYDFCKEESDKNEENILYNNTNSYKTNFKKFNKDIKTNIDINMNNTFNKDRAKSISLSLNNVENPKNKISFVSLLPKNLKKNRKKSELFSERINTNINTDIVKMTQKNKTKNENNKSLKAKTITKYTGDFVKNCIYKKILNNANLKILYQTNEQRIKRMIKSQCKANKNKFTIIKYQKNLIKNSILPLNNEQRIKLMKSFSKINHYVQSEKKINLQKYLNDIQNKEKKIIKYHNSLNQNYINNIKKIGFSPQKRLLKLDKVVFKDIFRK